LLHQRQTMRRIVQQADRVVEAVHHLVQCADLVLYAKLLKKYLYLSALFQSSDSSDSHQLIESLGDR